MPPPAIRWSITVFTYKYLLYLVSRLTAVEFAKLTSAGDDWGWRKYSTSAFFFLTCAVRMSTGYGGYPMSKLQVEYMYTITAHHITHHRWHGSGWHHSLQRPRPEALSPLNLLNSTRRPLQNIPYDLSSLTVPYSSRFGWARDARRAEICGCEAVWSDLL